CHRGAWRPATEPLRGRGSPGRRNSSHTGPVALVASRHQRSAMEFRILGSLEIADGDRLVPLGAGKPRALLAILLIHANEIVSNERLIEDLWTDTPPATATKSVQVYVSQVRKALRSAERADGGDGIVFTRPGGYLLSLAADRLDANRLEEALQEGRRALERGDP